MAERKATGRRGGRAGSARSGGRAGGGGRKEKRQYKKRDAGAYKKRANQQGGSRDGFLADAFSMFTPKEGPNRLRILPPAPALELDHYGIEVYVHYQIGPDEGQYLCSEKMKDEECPICEERRLAEADGDTDYAKDLQPTKRVLVWVIDREREDEGPLLWPMAWTIDRDICKLAVDSHSGEIYSVDDPYDGYDVEFDREGKGVKTKYAGLQIARRPSELGNEDWLDFTEENALPDTLVYFDAEHIRNVFAGHAAPSTEDDKKEKPSDRNRGGRGKAESEQEEPAGEEAAYTRDELLGMDTTALEDIWCDELELPEEELADFDSDEDLVKALCEELNIPEEEEPEPEPEPEKEKEEPAGRRGRGKGKMAEMRGSRGRGGK